MDVLNDIFELDTLFENNQISSLKNKFICISIPFHKFTHNKQHEPMDFHSTLKMEAIYIGNEFIILECELIISNNNKIYKFEFEYYWNFILNVYKLKNNFYKNDLSTTYIKDSLNENNKIRLSGLLFNTLIFKIDYPTISN